MLQTSQSSRPDICPPQMSHHFNLQHCSKTTRQDTASNPRIPEKVPVHNMTVAMLLCRYFALLRQAFAAWLGFQLHRQNKRQQLRQLEAVHAFWMRKQTWAVWRQQFLPTAREKSRACARANKHWQSNALWSAVHAWAEVGAFSCSMRMHVSAKHICR